MTDRAPRNDLSLPRLQWTALAVGGLATVACLGGLAVDARQFFRSYLVVYFYWWIVSTGCLGLALLYQMTGGRWGYAARPFFDSGVRTLPLVALGFIPLALGLDQIYLWTEADYFSGKPHADNQAFYLSPTFFILRGVGYVLVTALLGLALTVGVVRPEGRMPTRVWPMVGGLGALLLLHIATFSAFDWTMSLEPFYYSTLWGALVVAGALLCGMCVCVMGVALALRRTGRCDDESLTVLHDLGKLLLAMVMIWAYLNFSQFLIIYSGNLPPEAAWYVIRLQGGWQWLAWLLATLHFALPFALLLSRSLKRDPRKIAAVALGLAAVHGIQVYWIITPAFSPERFRMHWLDVIMPLALGGLWLTEFFRQLQHRLVPLLPHWPIPQKDHG